MNIRPINVADVTQAVADLLAEHPALSGVQVEQGEEINGSPTACPWLGVYRAGVKYPTRTLGIGAGFRRQEIELIVVAQASHPAAGKDCARELEDLLQHVIGALLSDPSLKGKVDILDEFEVRYPDYRRQDGRYFQTAFVYFTGVTNVTAY